MNLIISTNAWWKLPIATFFAFIAANMNATSGGGTFVTYPMLLALGETSVIANATSTVGLWPGLVAVLPGLKHEISTQKRHIKILFMPVVVGAITGSFLLSHTPSRIFGFVAPVLIFFGAILLQFNANFIRFLEKINLGDQMRRLVIVCIGVFIVGIYAAYFGAGIGILFLGILSLLGFANFTHYLALKNVLAMLANSCATIYFVSTGLIHWPVAAAMACGSIVGGITGSRLVHRVNKDMMRKYTVIFGFTISITLLIIRISQ